MKKIIVGVTGASGAQLAYHMLKALRTHEVEIHLILSEGAKTTILCETEHTVEDFRALSDAFYSEDEISACVASGRFRTDGMIVVPCSMKTLSGIANAFDENLIIRAADVCLKERRKLVLVPREMPLNNAHLRNMLTASRDGEVAEAVAQALASGLNYRTVVVCGIHYNTVTAGLLEEIGKITELIIRDILLSGKHDSG